MDVIKRFGLIICLLMVLMAYLKQAIPRGKTTALMKAIISIFILISIIDGIRTFDLDRLKDLFTQPYSISWDDTVSDMTDGLKAEFESFLADQGINSKVQTVEIENSNGSLLIKKVTLSGKESEMAKKLLSARYQIEEGNIEVKNE